MRIQRRAVQPVAGEPAQREGGGVGAPYDHRPGAAQWQFTALEAKLGRDPASDLVLEDKTISAQHARLTYHHRQWWIEDLRSTNGTYLNEEPVTAPIVLTDGDHLRLGGLVFQVQLDSQPNQNYELGETPT